MTSIIRFFHVLCLKFLMLLSIVFLVYWAQIKSFPLDSVVSKLCDLTHFNCVLCAFYSLPFFPSSLFLSPLYTFCTHPHPHFHSMDLHRLWAAIHMGQW